MHTVHTCCPDSTLLTPLLSLFQMSVSFLSLKVLSSNFPLGETGKDRLAFQHSTPITKNSESDIDSWSTQSQFLFFLQNWLLPLMVPAGQPGWVPSLSVVLIFLSLSPPLPSFLYLLQCPDLEPASATTPPPTPTSKWKSNPSISLDSYL